MARVCPRCRRLAGDDEITCRACDAPTVTPDLWRQLRETPSFQPAPAPSAKADPPMDPQEAEFRVRFGLGGMVAFLMFFVVFLIVYLFKALT